MRLPPSLGAVVALSLLLAGLMGGYAIGISAQWEGHTAVNQRHLALHEEEAETCTVVARIGGRNAARLATVLTHHGFSEERTVWGDELRTGAAAASP